MEYPNIIKFLKKINEEKVEIIPLKTFGEVVDIDESIVKLEKGKIAKVSRFMANILVSKGAAKWKK
ncbi:hypothetical protein DRN69_00240 [Candidatus Pacearchaeota archaeon]|nr:MAG: hypothetical protein DRN69_00240 [Candidatus Pacearchaeota archaeon]